MTAVAKNTVVTITYTLSDTDGEILEQSEQPHSYLHGGYGNVFESVEKALEGKSVGDVVDIKMQPDEAFGEYDEQLVRIEDRNVFPPELEVGMQFEGHGESSGEMHIYTVTDITDDKVVVDGNHPLAGQAIVFHCQVTDVREADPHEIEHRHAHGAHGHHHHH